MCGIIGIYNFDHDRIIDKHKLKRMTDSIYHRGPDGDGFYVNGNVGFGHRRLSIIDLDTGAQPMFNSDKSIAIVFNGEIYNYIELSEELGKRGHLFDTNSDTEVIIKAYEQWGIECQNKFNGMWAFALWDNKSGSLFLSRDRIGQKPLYYAEYDNSFIFGSEIKTIFEYGVPKEPELEMIELYLVLANIPAPHTFFKNIKKLNPGHYLIVNHNGINEYKYWDLPLINEDNMISDRKYVYENFSNLLKDSVKIRMRSDVPYGAFLSGGLDSSIIVSLMSEISSFPVNTFTIGFDEHKDYDESKLALEVSNRYKTKHNLGRVNPEKFKNVVDKVVTHCDEPFGDPSAVAVNQVSKYASRYVKMVLTGDGGDELLSGYTSYQGIKFAGYYKRLPSILQLSLSSSANIIKSLFKNDHRYKLERVSELLHSSNKPFNKLVIDKICSTSYKNINDLIKFLPKQIGIEEWFSDFMQNCPYKDDFYKLMYFNYKHSLPNGMLVKVDRMSMANSLETRSPFLDYRLIEFMVNVDKKIKMQGWELKSVLKKSLGHKIPSKVLNAPKKGFVVPLREWFKEKKFESNLHGLLNVTILDRDAVSNIIFSNKEGLKDNGNFIWRVFILEDALDNL